MVPCGGVESWAVAVHGAYSVDGMLVCTWECVAQRQGVQRVPITGGSPAVSQPNQAALRDIVKSLAVRELL